MKERPYIKPQFLIDDDDEYQDFLEMSYEANDIDKHIDEIVETLEGYESFKPDGEETGYFLCKAAEILHRNGYKINIRKS
jgi:hypothetical protein